MMGVGCNGWEMGRVGGREGGSQGGSGEYQGDRGMAMECLYIHEY